MTTVRQWTGRETAVLRAALRLSLRDFAAKLGVDIRTITKWQARGTGVVLRPHMQQVLDIALEQAGEATKSRFADMLREEGALFGSSAPSDRSGSVRDVDRQQLLRASGAVLALPWIDLFASTKSAWVPVKIDSIHIEQVRTAAAALSSLDNTYGGELAREAAFAQLRWSAQLLRAACPEKLRPELFAAVARLAQAAGFMAVDADAHEDARRAFRFGLACAEHAENWHVQTALLSDMALQAAWSGRAHDGLIYADKALARADQLTTTGRAMLHTVRARVLAKLHRTQEALSAVGAGDDAFAQADPTDEPAWMGPHDHVWHQALTGHALFDLAIAGRKTQAEQRLKYTVDHPKQNYGRLRAVSRTKHATLLMATGDPHEAATVGNKAVDEAGSIRSRRVVNDLRTLQRFAGRHPKIAEAVELRRRIGEVVHAS
jgi:transcriptional regulator with XRE-family HTH domain